METDLLRRWQIDDYSLTTLCRHGMVVTELLSRMSSDPEPKGIPVRECLVMGHTYLLQGGACRVCLQPSNSGTDTHCRRNGSNCCPRNTQHWPFTPV